MIHPPSFYSDQRQEYDMLDLEQLGHFAVDLGLHTLPNIKLLFSQMVEIVGTPEFGPRSKQLQIFLMEAWTQSKYCSEYQHFYDLHPVAYVAYEAGDEHCLHE